MPANLRQIISDFHSLPVNKKSDNLTIFEISGHPHYENVCSNVLAFYLNPSNEHMLGTIVLRGFLEQLNVPITKELEESLQSAEVIREQRTLSGNRIDILIIVGDYIIAIENKIYASLDNDLSDYWCYLQKSPLAINIPHKLGFVLGIFEYQTNHPNFKSVTYNSIIPRLRSEIQETKPQNKWNFYILDLFDNLLKMNSQNSKPIEFDSQDNFVIHNIAAIQQINKAQVQLQEKLNSQIDNLLKFMNENFGNFPFMEKERWIYAKNCLVHDLKIDGNSVAFDMYLDVDGWRLEILGRNAESKIYLRNQLNKLPQKNSELSGSKYIYKKWPISTTFKDVGLDINSIIHEFTKTCTV